MHADRDVAVYGRLRPLAALGIKVTHTTVEIVVVQADAARLSQEVSALAWRERRSEWGGLLFGRVYEGPHGLVAWVAAMVPGLGSGTPTSFEFSPASFPYARNVLNKHGYDDDLLELGFWHSHPSYHPFMSFIDIDYFHLSFPKPWSLSIVIDPLNHEGAAFVKKGAGVRPVGAYSVDDARFGSAPRIAAWRPWLEVGSP
jgi:proteasome lid subunit RPN8/RPN11